MLNWLITLGVLYVSVLIFLSLKSKKTIHTANDFMLGGAKIGLVLGFMTFAATLFSTFTLMGMPDFSRKNGVDEISNNREGSGILLRYFSSQRSPSRLNESANLLSGKA